MYMTSSTYNLSLLDNTLKNYIGVVGFLGTIVGVISFLPVLYVVYKTKKTNNFPYKALLLALVSNLLWIFYAFKKGPKVDTQVAFMGILYFLIYSFILHTKITN